MSEVYEGLHAPSGRTVAVKVLSAEWCLHPELVARFLNEAQALQRLRHARIVTAFSSGTLPNGPPFIILEWLPVGLHQVLAREEGALSPRLAVHVARQLAEALAALHAQGIVHRDLKPANVLLAREERPSLDVKLADLGLAKLPPSKAVPEGEGEDGPLAISPVSTGGGAMLGTWDYMAPEQWIASKCVDPKTDVYALGVLLFQMLAGRLPFVAEQQKDLMYLHLLEPPPLGLLGDAVSAELRGLISEMLSKKAAPRPTMSCVVVRLASLLDGLL
jgi:serine/threonine-protein kinase